MLIVFPRDGKELGSRGLREPQAPPCTPLMRGRWPIYIWRAHKAHSWFSWPLTLCTPPPPPTPCLSGGVFPENTRQDEVTLGTRLLPNFILQRSVLREHEMRARNGGEEGDRLTARRERNPRAGEKGLTFEHGCVIGKLIPRPPPPPVTGMGAAVSPKLVVGPPVLLPSLPSSRCLHGKEANGWGLQQPWFPWQPSGGSPP